MADNNFNLTKSDLETIITNSIRAVLAYPDPTEPAPVYGHANEVGKRFGLHANTIRNWHKRGLIKKYKIEKVSLFKYEEVANFIMSNGQDYKSVKAQS